MMKIAITGATGFIGKLLVEKHLQLGDEVHVLTRNKGKIDLFDSRVKIHLGDLSHTESLTDFIENIDVLYHCAAEIRDESKMRLINVEGTINLINAAKGKVKHWVQLSSVGVYGPIYKGEINENQSYNPINEYEKTKLESDLIVLKAAQSNSFTYTFVRPSNVFGAQMRNQSLFQLIRTIENGYYFFIGPKGASANYVPVENVIEALYLAGTHLKAKNNIYNISSHTSIENFIGYISENLNRPYPKFRIPIGIIMFMARLTFFIPKNPLTVSRVNALSVRTIYLNSKIENELGYNSVKTIKEGVRDLVLNYKNQKNNV